MKLAHIVGAFCVSSVVVALAFTPFAKLPSQAGPVLVAMALLTVVSLMLAVLASWGVLVALLLRNHKRVLLALAVVALGLGAVGVEEACTILTDAEAGLDFEELYGDFGVAVEAMFFTLGVAALLAVLPFGVGAKIGRAGVVVGAVAVVGAAATLLFYGSMMTRMPQALLDDSVLPSFAHRLVAYAFDGDGDGSPAFLDCDDDDPLVNPMRADIPGNGKDDNCLLGEDEVGKFERFPRAPYPRPVDRVILFLWDATRADHLNVYGYPRDTTPNLTRFAEESIVFKHVSSSGGMTRQYLAGLLTGRYQKPPIHEEFADTNLLYALKDEGIKARACFVHKSASIGWEHGFDEVECPGCENLAIRNLRKTGPITWECSERLIERTDLTKKELIIVHVFDQHFHFARHKGTPKAWRRKTPINRYDGELYYADRFFKKIMDRMEERGLLENAAVIVTADHGESFGEHGALRHGKQAYEETNRVPLIVRLPERKGFEWIEQPVENGDLSATILDLLGAQTPTLQLSGASLVPLLLDPTVPFVRPRAMGYAMHEPAKGLKLTESFALVDYPWKAIWDRQVNLWSLHHLENDPHEQTNLALDRADLLKPMQQELELRVERFGL